MNIEEYRAMVKAQAEAKDSQKEQPEAKPPEVVTPPEITPPTPEPTTPPETLSTPSKIQIEGVGEVDLDELKAGYLRTQDYTRKTQEVARTREETKDAITLYETIKSNPQLAEVLKNSIDVPKTVDPTTSKIVELENRMYDMMLDREIETLQNKYTDFNVMEVLDTAQKEKITSLEKAYLLNKAMKGDSTPQTQSIDLDAERQRIRQELMKELENERSSTSTIISSNDVTVPVQTEQPKISPAEQKVARMFGWTDEQYIKARDNKR